jgi:hypothetical protein
MKHAALKVLQALDNCQDDTNSRQQQHRQALHDVPAKAREGK